MALEHLEREIQDIERVAAAELPAADPAAREEWRTKYLGRKGALARVMSLIPGLPAEDRPAAGRRLNTLKERLQGLFSAAGEAGPAAAAGNLSFPGRRPAAGARHPLTLVTREMTQIFVRMGFGIATGPEIETDYYNFDALNTPADHPAKDMWDTLYLDPARGVLLRTHTSPVQIRVMKKSKPPLRVVAVGRCFRRDAPDASHSPVFHQMEGLMVGPDITFAHLKGTLIHFLRELFRNDVRVRFTPSYFPFTEPSAEVGISCIICGGTGCPTCGQSGWLEILGCGMVHPQVFRNVGYDPALVRGFAFGMGIERIAMLKHGIRDIRHFCQSDLRFVRQFA